MLKISKHLENMLYIMISHLQFDAADCIRVASKYADNIGVLKDRPYSSGHQRIPCDFGLKKDIINVDGNKFHSSTRR